MKNKMMKKLLATTLATIMTIGMLGGCGSEPAEPAEESNVAEEQEAVEEVSQEEEKEPVELEMIVHYDQSFVAALEKVNAMFTEKYPWITINMQTTETAQWQEMRKTRLAAGDVDIVEAGMFGTSVPEWAIGTDTPVTGQFAKDGLLMDLTGQAFMENWGAVTLANACTYDGKLYNVPTGLTATGGIFYNKEIFAEYNLSEPKTWDEFINICETLKEAGIAPMTSGLKDTWPTGMFWTAIAMSTVEDIDTWAEGLWTGDAAFNDEETMKVWKKIESVAPYFEEGVNMVDNATAPSRFMSGKAAMLPDGTWTAAAINTGAPDFEYGYFAVPGDEAPADGSPAQLVGKYDVGIAGYANTEHPEEVLLWLEFFSQPEVYTEYINMVSAIPVMPGVVATDEFRADLAEKTKDFKVEFGYHFFAPAGVGKYAHFSASSNLAGYGGTIATVEELADLAQKDFADAVSKVTAE